MTRTLLTLVVGLPVLIGCSSAKPPPPPPAPIAAAQRSAEQGAKLTEAENWPAAVRAWQSAVDEYRLLNDRGNEALALHNLGQAKDRAGDFDGAHAMLEQAVLLHSALKLDQEWWKDQLALLQVEAKAERTNDLARRFDRLEKDSSKLPAGQLRALYLNERGLWLSRAGDFDKAAADFKAASQLFASTHDANGEAAVVSNEALLLERQNKPELAADKWNSALSRFQAMANPLGIAISMRGRGRTLLASGQNLTEAEDLLRRAARNFKTLRQEKEMPETVELLRRALEKNGKPFNASEI